jgi:hypothetical protein
MIGLFINKMIKLYELPILQLKNTYTQHLVGEEGDSKYVYYIIIDPNNNNLNQVLLCYTTPTERNTLHSYRI